jgi:hypothetical protein
MERKHQDISRKDEPKKVPATDPGRKESPKRHEEAPGRRPAPTVPDLDDDTTGELPDRDSEMPDERERDADDR